MTEPNSPEPKPAQEPPSLGKRVLAAIMFTDAVAFSRRANEDEEHTLRVAARDLATIGDIVKRFEGRVIKHTGDGLLAFFTSGVQAVAGALEIQHTMAEQAKMLPPSEVLQHRIGIHLGDVFLSRNEVMGDGVNVAARLQSEAPPGGICITQALYEIAKNRLSLHTVHMGARQLKNIPESVQVYQVLTEADLSRPPDASAPRAAPGGPLTVAAPPAAEPAPVALKVPAPAATSVARPKRRRRWVLAAAAAALVVVALVVLSAFVPMPWSGASRAAPASDLSLLDEPLRGEYAREKERRLAVRDYDALASWIRERGLQAPDSPLHVDYVKYRRLGVLFGWTEDQLGTYRASEPLVAKGRGGDVQVYASGGSAVMRTPKGTRPLDLRKDPPGLVLTILSAVARERWRGAPIDREDYSRARLLEGIHLFARETRQPVKGLLDEFKRPEEVASFDEDDDAFDLDGDGRLSPAEMPPELRARLALADADNDASITRREYLDFRRKAPAP